MRASLIGALIGTILGNVLYVRVGDRVRIWLTKRRCAELERRVAAELLSRGVDFEAIMLKEIRGNAPGPVTDALVKNISDFIEHQMRMTEESS